MIYRLPDSTDVPQDRRDELAQLWKLATQYARETFFEVSGAPRAEGAAQ